MRPFSAAQFPAIRHDRAGCGAPEGCALPLFSPGSARRPAPRISPASRKKRALWSAAKRSNPSGSGSPGGSKVNLSPARSPRCGLHRLRLSGPLPGLLTPQDALLHHRYDMVNGFGAVLHQPFRNDGHQSADIECHDIFPVPIRDPEPLQNRREHMPEQPVIGLVQAQRSGILDGGSEKPSVILCKIQIGNQIFRC